MKSILLLVTACCTLIACEKQRVESTDELTGKWMLTEQRADPGDGSGQWHPVTINQVLTIEFKSDGSFESSDNNNIFNRYTLVGDTITLFHSLSNNVSMKLAVQELTTTTLAYYYGWPWCGGPTGSKYTRKN